MPQRAASADAVREEVGATVLSKVLYGVIGTLIAVMLVAVGFLGRVVTEPSKSAAPTDTQAKANAQAVDQEFGILGEIAKVLGEDYVEADKAKSTVLRDGAIQGIFEALKDPHSTYISPSDYALQKNDFEEIGRAHV